MEFMKKIALFVMLVALLALGANAVQISSPTLGDDNQDRVSNVVTTFTITNNGTVNLTDISLSKSAGAEASKYNLAFTSVPDLAPGASATVTMNGTIPLNHPGVDKNLKETSIKIGAITVTGTAGNAQEIATADVNMQAINQFRIKRARVDCGSKSESVDDGDEVKNLKPGFDCTLEIEIENNFDDDDRDNQKIGDIEFTSIDFDIESSDNDIDIDEDNDVDDLDADDEDVITADIEIDDDADDGTVRIEVEISARDENGALHGEAFDFRLEIDRLTHDIQIRRIDLSPSAVSNCGASTAKVDISLLNQGKRDEDDAAVEVIVDSLAFREKIENIELDEDDSTAVSFTILVPADTKEGVTRVEVRTYFDSLALSNSGSVELLIKECEEDGEDEAPSQSSSQSMNDQQQTSVVVPQAPITPTAGQSQAAPKKDSSFTESKAYVAMLAVLSVLIAAGIVALVVLLVRKKQA